MKNRYYHVTYLCEPAVPLPDDIEESEQELQKIEVEIHGEASWAEASTSAEIKLLGILKPGTNYKLTGVYSHVE